jgi:hypothetical protein
MSARITIPETMSITSILRLGLLGGLIAAAPLVAAGQANHDHNHDAPSKLVRIVRAATQQYIDVNNAGPDYIPLFGCVSGPDHGAMGIHYVNLSLLDGQIDAEHPEALIYEPVGNKRRLVGVEYIVDAPTWLADKSHNGLPPQLEGQAFQLVGTPNRYGIPSPFFELHVWAWRDNPNGAFVDWNNKVSCEGQ